MHRRSHHELTYYDHGYVAVCHYHLSGHQTRVVALGGIAKRKGVLMTIQPSLFREMFVDNTVTFGHQARTMALKFSLEEQKQKIKRTKAKNKNQ
jgi:hypothetical protein